MYRYSPHTQRGQHTHGNKPNRHTCLPWLHAPPCPPHTHTLHRTISSLFSIRQLRVCPYTLSIQKAPDVCMPKSSGDITRTELQRSLDCPMVPAVAPAPTRAQTKPMPPLPTRPNGLSSSNNNDQRLSVSSSALPVYVFRDKKALPPVPSDAPLLSQQPPQLPPQPMPVHPSRYSLQVTPNRRRVAPPMMHLPSRPPPVPTPALSKSAALPSPRSPRPPASPSSLASSTTSYTSSTLLSPRTPPPPLALSGSGAKYAAPPVPVRPREARAAAQFARPLPTSPTYNT